MPSDSRTPRLWGPCPCPRAARHPGLMGDWNRRCRRGARSCGGSWTSLCDPERGWPQTWPLKEVPGDPGCGWGPAWPHPSGLDPLRGPDSGGPGGAPEQASPSPRLPTPGPAVRGRSLRLLPGPGHLLSGARLPEGVWPVCPQARGLARGGGVRGSGSGPECVRRPIMGQWGRDGVWGPI